MQCLFKCFHRRLMFFSQTTGCCLATLKLYVEMCFVLFFYNSKHLNSLDLLAMIVSSFSGMYLVVLVQLYVKHHRILSHCLQYSVSWSSFTADVAGGKSFMDCLLHVMKRRRKLIHI